LGANRRTIDLDDKLSRQRVASGVENARAVAEGRKGVIPCICMYKYTEWLFSECAFSWSALPSAVE
jgi:hypothetical protein